MKLLLSDPSQNVTYCMSDKKTVGTKVYETHMMPVLLRKGQFLWKSILNHKIFHFGHFLFAVSEQKLDSVLLILGLLVIPAVPLEVSHVT